MLLHFSAFHLCYLLDHGSSTEDSQRGNVNTAVKTAMTPAAISGKAQKNWVNDNQENIKKAPKRIEELKLGTNGTMTGDMGATIDIPPANNPEKRPAQSYRKLQSLNKAQQNRKIQFDAAKCIVIWQIKDLKQMKQDDNIRRLVGENKGIVIDQVTHTHSGNIMVQLAETEAVQVVINYWDGSLFGGSKARKTIAPPQKMHGVMKGVPVTIGDKLILGDLHHQGYSNIVIKRIKKGNSSTMAVKVTFESVEDLRKAIKDDLTIQHIITRVEKMSLKPMRCYNCQRYGHMAGQCQGAKICAVCAESYNDSHDFCSNDKKCTNCGKAHTSRDRNCPKYKRIYNRLNH